jgi:hypothetical protein
MRPTLHDLVPNIRIGRRTSKTASRKIKNGPMGAEIAQERSKRNLDKLQGERGILDIEN